MAHSSIENVFYPRNAIAPTVASPSGATVSGQALAITGTTTASFSAFNQFTKQVYFDIQTADVIVTTDGTNPVLLSRGHLLKVGTNQIWNADRAKNAKFVSTAASSFIFCQEIAI